MSFQFPPKKSRFTPYLGVLLIIVLTTAADLDTNLSKSRTDTPVIQLSSNDKEKPTNEKTSQKRSVLYASLDRAVNWIHQQRTPDWGWGSSTPQTVLALAIAGNLSLNGNLESQLIVKEYELQLVIRLWNRRNYAALTTGRVSLHVMTLLALCKDPRDFQSKDLLAMLEHQEPQVDFEESFATLGLCISGKNIRKSRIRGLLDMALASQSMHFIDTLSISILALECVQRQGRHDVLKYINESLRTLLQEQEDDGSFKSNLHTTALVLQALSVSKMNSTWNTTKAQQYVMSHQMSDGSFGDMFSTNAILPFLAGKTLLDVANIPCEDNTYYTDESLIGTNDDDRISTTSAPYSEQLENINIKTSLMINVTYIIWVGKDGAVRFNLTFCVPQNTSFLEIMKMAAERDERFVFSASKWPNEYYVHTLAGQKENQTGFWFWLLYKLREPPVPGVKPDNKFVAPAGVQVFMPEDGDYVLFWYHQI